MGGGKSSLNIRFGVGGEQRGGQLKGDCGRDSTHLKGTAVGFAESFEGETFPLTEFGERRVNPTPALPEYREGVMRFVIGGDVVVVVGGVTMAIP